MSKKTRNFSNSVKLIHKLLSPERQELMKPALKSMIVYVEKNGDPEGKGAEKRFRTFMLLHRHWLISEKKVSADHFGKSFIQATTDEIWEEGRALYRELKEGAT